MPTEPDPSTDRDGDVPPRMRRFVGDVTGRVQRARERADAGVHALEERRPRSRLVDTLFTLVERDRDIYGGTLAGALAFRLFIFLVPFTLVVVVLLGVVVSGDPGSASGLSERFGMRGAIAQMLVDAAEQGRTNRWWALLVGLGGTGWAALGCVRALRLTHFLAWDEAPGRLASWPRAIAAFVGLNVAVLGVPLVAGWAGVLAGVFGHFAGIVGVFAVYVALWVCVSYLLPHGGTPWRYLVPGAIVVAVGTHLLHLVTRYYFAPRLDAAASVYGAIGVAAVVMTWLFLVARLLVSSAVVNAVLAEHRHPSRHTQPASSASSAR